MDLAEPVKLAEQVMTLWVPTALAGGAVWRWVFKPWIVAPTLGFFRSVSQAVDTIHDIAPKVNTMSLALGPNGGKSLADVIHRTAGRMNLLLDHSPVPTWEAAADGANTRVNPAFELLFGYSAAEIRGHGWKNLLHEDEAEDYIGAWMSSIKDVRMFRYQGTFVTRDRRHIEVLVLATPTPGLDTILWMGTIRVIQPGRCLGDPSQPCPQVPPCLLHQQTGETA